MATDRHIYGEVNSKTGMRKVFSSIRGQVNRANSRPALSELYKRAGYMVTLTHAPSWKEKWGRQAGQMTKLGEEEFNKTARKINSRAKKIDVKADYDETWGK
jgi:hypothetical protein